MTLRTEYAFVLPRGYLDGTGRVHREGVMRLATARDELAAMRHPRVGAEPGYATIVLLAQVLVRIGAIDAVDAEVVEGLFTADLAHLQDLYSELNFGPLDEAGPTAAPAEAAATGAHAAPAPARPKPAAKPAAKPAPKPATKLSPSRAKPAATRKAAPARRPSRAGAA